MKSNLDYLPNNAEITMFVLDFQTALEMAANAREREIIEMLEGELRFYSGDVLKGYKTAIGTIKG